MKLTNIREDIFNQNASGIGSTDVYGSPGSPGQFNDPSNPPSPNPPTGANPDGWWIPWQNGDGNNVWWWYDPSTGGANGFIGPDGNFYINPVPGGYFANPPGIGYSWPGVGGPLDGQPGPWYVPKGGNIFDDNPGWTPGEDPYAEPWDGEGEVDVPGGEEGGPGDWSPIMQDWNDPDLSLPSGFWEWFHGPFQEWLGIQPPGTYWNGQDLVDWFNDWIEQWHQQGGAWPSNPIDDGFGFNGPSSPDGSGNPLGDPRGGQVNTIGNTQPSSGGIIGGVGGRPSAAPQSMNLNMLRNMAGGR